MRVDRAASRPRASGASHTRQLPWIINLPNQEMSDILRNE
jgi:hypothetical protein